MNNTSDSNASPAGATNSSSNPHTAPSSGRWVFESLRMAANEGAQQARAVAENVIPKIKTAAWCATYWAGYGASFTTVFSYCMVKDLAPEALKAGCRDGGQAARKAAEDLSARLQARSAAPDAGQPPAPPASAAAAQPGAA